MLVLQPSVDKHSVCLKTVAGIQWTMKLEYPKMNCYGVLVSSVAVWYVQYNNVVILDEGCDFLTTNCNTTSFPYSCTGTSRQCFFDYQSFVSTPQTLLYSLVLMCYVNL